MSANTTYLNTLWMNLSETVNGIGFNSLDERLLSNESATKTLSYWGNAFELIRDKYGPIHGYLSLLVCVFGIVSNVLNIIVLTRKEMQSATNSILTGLAVADMLVMLEYIPFCLHFHFASNPSDSFTYNSSVFTLWHAHFSVVCHSISTWLTVLLAIWRYLAVSFPTDCKKWCSLKNTRWTIFFTYILVPIFCVPVYLSFTIVKSIDGTTDGVNQTIYRVDWSEVALKRGELLKKVNFWIYSVGTKLVPCVLLTYLSLALIRVLIEAEKRKQRLKQNPRTLPRVVTSIFEAQSEVQSTATTPTTAVTTPTSCSSNLSSSVQTISSQITKTETLLKRQQQQQQQKQQQQQQQPSDRTTRMLLSVLLLFLITEFPSGILGLLSAILGDEFHKSVYQPLGEVMDALALVNSSINFILYCTMSRLFRVTFVKLFCIQRLNSTNVSERDEQRPRRTSYTIGQTELQPTINTTCI